MKKIKNILFILGFTLLSTGMNAQSALTFEASQLYASFKFSDSQETMLNQEYSGIFPSSYTIGYRYILDNGIMIRTGLGMRKAGATMVYDNMNYTWNLQYADFKFGGGYILKKNPISPYLTVSGYFAYMLRGYQTINNEDFDIKYSESLKFSDYGIFVTPGVQFKISESVTCFAEFNYMMGLQNLEKDEVQRSRNFAYGITLGLSLSISK